jgi:hypothetical protein
VDLTGIRNALAQQITDKTGLRAEGQPRDSVVPPVALVLPGSPLVTYGVTMDGSAAVSLAVLILVTDAPGAEMSQAMLDGYLGIGAGESGSVVEAILADPSLGGAVNWCQPVTIGRYGRVQWAAVDYFGASVNFTVGAI